MFGDVEGKNSEWVTIEKLELLSRKNYLLLRRSPQETSFHGMFELPGGELEAGETAQQAAVIETKEEAGLDVKVVDKIGQHVDHDMKKIYHGFIVKMKKGQRVKLSEEHDSHKWATIGEIMKMPRNKLVSPGISFRNFKQDDMQPQKDRQRQKPTNADGKEPEKPSTEKIDLGDGIKSVKVAAGLSVTCR